MTYCIDCIELAKPDNVMENIVLGEAVHFYSKTL